MKFGPCHGRSGPCQSSHRAACFSTKNHALAVYRLASRLASSPQSPIEFSVVGPDVSILPWHPQRSALQTSNFRPSPSPGPSRSLLLCCRTRDERHPSRRPDGVIHPDLDLFDIRHEPAPGSLPVTGSCYTTTVEHLHLAGTIRECRDNRTFYCVHLYHPFAVMTPRSPQEWLLGNPGIVPACEDAAACSWSKGGSRGKVNPIRYPRMHSGRRDACSGASLEAQTQGSGVGTASKLRRHLNLGFGASFLMTAFFAVTDERRFGSGTDTWRI